MTNVPSPMSLTKNPSKNLKNVLFYKKKELEFQALVHLKKKLSKRKIMKY